MFKISGKVLIACALGVVCTAGPARGQIGEPLGMVQIMVKQGSTEIVNSTVTLGPGGDLPDLKDVSQDGTPESYTQIGTIGSEETPIVLRVVTDGHEDFRITHWYIDVPVSMEAINTPGPTSLFQPGAGPLEVIIMGLSFDNQAVAIPFVLNSPNYYTSFMRDIDGHFYNTPGVHPYNAYGNAIIDVQVPGTLYTDGLASPYDFEVLQSGQTMSWAWRNILAPTTMTTVTNEFGDILASNNPGYVFEIGLSAAFIQIPEPGTLALVAMTPLMLLRRRRRK